MQTLELVMMHKEAHDKHRIHCLAAGKDGFLYSGGEDKVRMLDFAAVSILSRLVGKRKPCLTPCLGSGTFPHVVSCL